MQTLKKLDSPPNKIFLRVIDSTYGKSWYLNEYSVTKAIKNAYPYTTPEHFGAVEYIRKDLAKGNETLGGCLDQAFRILELEAELREVTESRDYYEKRYDIAVDNLTPG